VTAAADAIRRRIAAEGPLTVAAFMAEALGHPRHGYYATRDPLGAAGDFTTAPEISQMFGELLGLWCADAWIRAGAPPRVLLVELGPGRGTLMADALRAARGVPGFRAAAEVHLVETSPVLRARQAETLRGEAPAWHDDLSAVPDGPMLLVANEFFDALPVRQFQRTERGWRERRVDADPATGGLRLALDPAPSAAEVLIPESVRRGAPVGSVAEVSPASRQTARAIGERLAAHGGAALVVDYGHDRPGAGDTLQAVRGHAYADVLDAPGEADLTAHVCFASLADAARAGGADAHGPVGQGDLLVRLGIRERAEALTRRHPGRAAEVAAARDRLIGPDAMGTLFRALALTPAGAPAPAGFGPP
jgi:NADH dehydrogenase [ubiquinone] 1 alpha subcomplex assembly factor 7